MGFFGPYEYKTKQGHKFYLHVKDVGKTKFYYFSKDPVGALGGIPGGYEIALNPNAELPFLRKKAGRKKEKAPKQPKEPRPQKEEAPAGPAQGAPASA